MTLVFEVQILSIEQANIRQLLEIENAERSFPENDQLLRAKFLQGTIDMHLGKPGGVRQVGLGQGEFASPGLGKPRDLQSDE